ncbi:pentatricopeptide repeat-containing protein, putative [Ricinus communis]|uniref:Pentatricopeptide repeat-containing protein, putative n=1 Tax=Ricinus communis TaxID=3988 RepID=B9RQF3_RICCO|nr:pentatricopeptide repeat-containing protein, putative [Ricinus communis]
MLNAPLLRRNAILNSCLINILDKCNSMLELKKIHALVITLGLSQDEPFVSKILSFSALSDSGNINYSCWVLFSLLNPTIFNWNTVIRGYSKSKNPNGSISVFIQMLKVGVFPDYLTYPFLVKASARLLKRELGFSIHAHIIKHGFESDRFISNSLVHMYASFGDISCARYVFDGMPVKNLVSWNSMVDGSAKCGNMVLARQLFDLMPDRDVLSWSSLIDGYVKNGDYGDAMVVFDKMRVSGPKPNEVTMVSVLCACAHLGALDKGRMMHHYVIDNKLPLTLVLCTSLVDMYAKCGAINEAFDVFRGIPAELSDVLLWNAMIGGLATHGLVKESLDLFKEMNFVGVKPDEITYLSLLHACAHGGLVKEAWYFFDCLGKHGMTLKIEHYACIVDVMARAGQIAKAYQFLSRNMRKAMERMGVRKSPGYSFVAINESLHRFIAHDKTHPSSELIYMMLSFIICWVGSDQGRNLTYALPSPWRIQGNPNHRRVGQHRIAFSQDRLPSQPGRDQEEGLCWFNDTKICNHEYMILRLKQERECLISIVIARR